MEFEKDPKWKYALCWGELKEYKDDVYYNVDKKGNKRYWKDGNHHRDDGPAVECITGYKAWYKEGKWHREDGHARVWVTGEKQWYIEGVKYTEEEFKEKVKIMEFDKDPKWEDALRHGELKHYKNEVYYNVDKYGNKYYWKDGLWHRDDGPAVECLNGDKAWCKEGKLHRLDGPAIDNVNGDKQWYIEGKRYTEEAFLKIKKASGSDNNSFLLFSAAIIAYASFKRTKLKKEEKQYEISYNSRISRKS